ncbi:MAG: Na+/H+ antiporter [Candidatus Elarobacter sp.]
MNGAFLTALLAAIVAGAVLAKRFRIPYPVVFVVGGLVVALIPGIPTIALQPDLVFLLFLPPLIFGDGWTTDYRSFMRWRGPIFSLALGLVVCTSVAVALFTHWLIGIPLALGFVLGGILSPTDAVATDAIAEEVRMPLPLTTIIGGESLVNDASGLVIYRFGVVAVATGAFSLLAAFAQFVYVVVAGIAIGLGGAWLIAKLMLLLRKKGLSDELILVSLSLVTPFALYVPADVLGASGVLAALSGGIFMSRKSSQIFDADSRLAAGSVWSLLFFTFNGAAFVLVGLELRAVVRGMPQYSLATLIGWGLAVTALLIVVRFAWVFIVTYGRRRLWPKIRQTEGPDPPWQQVFVLGFAGMRGIVSLAAALAIPEYTTGGARFPGRDLLVFITFVVILVSLVGEGLTMPWLIRRFGLALAVDESLEQKALANARVRTYTAAREHLRTLEPSFASTAEWEVAGRLQATYEQRLSHYAAHRDGITDEDAGQHEIERRFKLDAYAAERRALVELRRSGEISDQIYRRLEWDIDLAESRLQ